MSFLQAIILNITAFILSATPVPVYKEGVLGRPNSFFSAEAKTQHERTISHLIFRGLFKYDIYGEIIPDLAETWSISDDSLVYTIKLKDKQYWTDGSKITADDLIYTAFTSPDLAGVATDKVDELTVRYTLPNKYSPFLSLLSVGVMHENSKEKENPLKPITSGDWRVVSIEKSGDKVNRVTLRTREEKYDIKKIIFNYYSNEEELEIASKVGEIDGFLAANTHEIDNFADYSFPEQGIYYAVYFNLENETVKDLALRQKLQKVLNLPEVIYDKGILVEGSISRSIYTDRNLKFNEYDAKVEDDLSDIVLTITTPEAPDHIEFVERIKRVWEDKLGVSVEINKVAPDHIVSEVINPRQFQILFYGQEVGRDPDRYVNWHSTQKVAPGYNLSLFENVRADRALEEGRNNYEEEERTIHYHEFQKAVNENIPAIFMYHPYVHFYVTKYIEGIGEKYTFTQSDRFLDLENWRRVSTN